MDQKLDFVLSYDIIESAWIKTLFIIVYWKLEQAILIGIFASSDVDKNLPMLFYVVTCDVDSVCLTPTTWPRLVTVDTDHSCQLMGAVGHVEPALSKWAMVA